MKKTCKKLISAILTAAVLSGIPAVSYARVQSHNAAFIYNFETDGDFTSNFVSATGGNTVSYSTDGFGGSNGAMKVDVVNGGTTTVSLGDMEKGYYKFSAYVKPLDFTPEVDKFAFTLKGTDFTATAIGPDEVGYQENKWVKVEAYYLLKSDVTSASFWLRLGDKNGNFTNTVGKSGLTSYSYLIDDIVAEKVSYEDGTVIYNRSFDTKQAIDGDDLNRGGGAYTLGVAGGKSGGYATLANGTAFKFFDKQQGHRMNANRVYRATVWAKAMDSNAVGTSLTFFEERYNGKGNSVTKTETTGKTLTQEWQLFEFDGIEHYASVKAQNTNFDYPRTIMLNLSKAANVAIDEFTIYEYPIYYNGDFEKSDISHLSVQGGGERVTEDGNSYLKFDNSSTGQILSYPYIAPGESYVLKYKIRLDSTPTINTTERTYDGIHSGIVFAFEETKNNVSTDDYETKDKNLSVQSKNAIYSFNDTENQTIGKWIEVSQTFTAPEPKDGGTARTPIAYFRVGGSIGKVADTSVAYSVDDIEIIPCSVPAISNLACDGNVKTGETVNFKWENDIPAGKYVYKIYKSSDDGWANVAAGTLTSAQTSVSYAIPKADGGKKLKFELTAYASSGRMLKKVLETAAVAEGDISSKITLTNAENNKWLEEEMLKGTVTVSNSSIFPGKLFAALYSGGALENVKTLTPTENDNGSYSFSVESGENTDAIKIMHWDAFNGMKPYAAAKSAECIEE